MKHLRLIGLLLVLGAQPAFAENGQLSVADTMNYWGFGAVIVALAVVLVAMLSVLKAFKVLTRLLLGPEAVVDKKAERTALKAERKAARTARIQKLLSLKPMSEEGSLLLEDDYDGIKELNNPTPGWFMGLFYVTMVFAVGYLLIYHVFKTEPLQYDEYKIEMADAAKAKAAYLAKSADKVDENTVKLTADPAVLADGKTIFSQRCAPCHGDHGQGVVGPNLTDDYWLHGNKINDLFKTIKYGVQAKGMPTWENQLTPRQIADVANFVKSIHGSHPANAKEPQGTKVEDEDDASAAKTAMVVK